MYAQRENSLVAYKTNLADCNARNIYLSMRLHRIASASRQRQCKKYKHQPALRFTTFDKTQCERKKSLESEMKIVDKQNMAHCTHTESRHFPICHLTKVKQYAIAEMIAKAMNKRRKHKQRETTKRMGKRDAALPQCVNESEIVNCYAFEIVLARFRYIHSHAYVIDFDGFPTTTTILCYCGKRCFVLKTGAFMACDKNITSSLDKTWWTLDSTFNRLTDRWKRICVVCFCLIHHLSSQFSLLYAISNCLPANECDYHNIYICAQFWHRSFTKQKNR